jgi:hypothetical protein
MMSKDDDDCTCDVFSWRGEGHASGCAHAVRQETDKTIKKLTRENELLKKRVEDMREALRIAEGMACSVKDRKQIPADFCESAIRLFRKLMRRR